MCFLTSWLGGGGASVRVSSGAFVDMLWSQWNWFWGISSLLRLIVDFFVKLQDVDLVRSPG